MKYTSGATAPVGVEYECLNVFGSRIGRAEHVTWGEPSLTTTVGFPCRRLATVVFLICVVHEIGIWLGGW